MTPRKPSATTDAKLREAIALHQAGKLAEAAALYERILAIPPKNADALHLLGLTHVQRGDTARGIALIEQAIAANGRVAMFHVNLGKAHQSLGRFDDAAADFRAALAIRRDDGEALLHLGLIERDRGDLKAAEECFRRAARLSPPPLAALNNLAAVLLEQQRLDETAPVVARALALAPDDHRVLGNQGRLLLGQGRYAEALVPLRRAAAADPDDAMLLNTLGIALHETHMADEAVLVLRRAVELAPTLAMARVSLGNALKQAERHDEALHEFLKADELRPGVAEVHSHIGTCHAAMLRDDEALAAFERCLAIKPDHAKARFSCSLLHLAHGRFGAGWKDYVWRPAADRLRPVALHERLDPARLRGAGLLVHRDQGLGDEIFFLRFLPELRRCGVARVVYATSPKLASILRRLDDLEVVEESAAPDMPGATIAVGDLPLVLGMASIDQIPPALPLVPLPDRVAELRAQLARLGPPPYLGVTWRGGTENAFGSLSKHAPLADIGRALAGCGGTVLALQRLPKAGEIDALSQAAGRPVHDLTDLNDDLEGMLALLSLLDDYVCVSNTNVHLRAGTGKTSRVLVPCPPEFRWMAEGDESPWFPGCRVYRQAVDRTWDAALAALRRDLATAFPPGSSA